MFRNYLLVALRSMKHNKVFTLINILGLSIGISSALVIYLLVHYDFGFDHFEPGGDRIFRVVQEFKAEGESGSGSRGTPGPIATALSKDISGFQEVVNFHYFNAGKQAVLSPQGAVSGSFREQKGIIFADGGYFRLLPYKWLAGSKEKALAEPRHVVLSESRAKTYFPQLAWNDMIGRTIVYNDSIRTQVSGIVEDLQKQGSTDFNFSEFISLATILDNPWMRKQNYWDDWGSTTSDHQVYVRLAKGVDYVRLDSTMNKALVKYQGDGPAKNHYRLDFHLQPLSDIHFNSRYGGFNIHVASRTALYGLMLVAVFLLLLGSINFINLTTAQAVQRAKEIGIRKTMGSSRLQLMLQFLSETALTTLMALVLSLVFVPLLLKSFHDFIPEGLTYSPAEPHLLLFMVVLVLAMSLLAGFYPALVLSGWQPIKVLKSQSYGGASHKSTVRQVLTVLQFLVAQAFVMGAFLVSKQVHFLVNRDLGFNKEAILSMETSEFRDTSYTHRMTFVHELQRISGVRLSSLGSDVPSSGGTWHSTIQYKGGPKEIEFNPEIKLGDQNYLGIFHIPLLAGRNLVASDTPREALITETMLRRLGIQRPVDAIGKKISWDRQLTIVGVVKDFYTHALDDINFNVEPIMITEPRSDSRKIMVALEPAASAKASWPATISEIEKLYKRMYPGEEFKYSFFDESLADFYQSERRVSTLLSWATGITVFISCLGLLGLVIYTTNRRVKEIGVRKVLGASAAEIVRILSLDFVKLVMIGYLFAIPLAWWAIHRWLEDFPFRTSMSWWIFALSGLGMLLTALITLSFQTLRAANANPVAALRSE